MELMSEEQLVEYVTYWGGSLSDLDIIPKRKGRTLSAEVFYCFHFPDRWPEKAFWKKTIKQAVTYLWTNLHWSHHVADYTFRTPECKAYFKQLLQQYINCYGEREVFRFRYQNWVVVDCNTMVDQLWTVLTTCSDDLGDTRS